MILERIGRETGVGVADLQLIVRTASHRYKTYPIEKRTGGRRIINHPTPELKYLQRWLCRNVFAYLPVHDAAQAYKKGVGIAENASMHAARNFLLKIDFQDFFPSIIGDDIRTIIANNLLRMQIPLADQDTEVVIKLVCKNGALTIGAPSSPILSNAVLYDFDCFISEICRQQNITYSRYADDIFASTDEPNKLSALLEAIREDLKERGSPALRINEAKTVFTSRKRKRLITGLVLTPQRRISIGRQKKRQVRTMVYLYGRNELSVEDVSYLRGYIAFATSVEPEFICRLRRKFGDDLLDQIMREELITQKYPGAEIDLA